MHKESGLCDCFKFDIHFQFYTLDWRWMVSISVCDWLDCAIQYKNQFKQFNLVGDKTEHFGIICTVHNHTCYLFKYFLREHKHETGTSKQVVLNLIFLLKEIFYGIELEIENMVTMYHVEDKWKVTSKNLRLWAPMFQIILDYFHIIWSFGKNI